MATAPKTKIGDFVELENETDRFEVVGKDRSMIVVRSLSGKARRQKVHYKRVVRVVAPEEVAKQSLATALDVEDPKGGKRSKREALPFDIEGMRAKCREIWVRTFAFDHKSVKTESYYFVAKDGRTAWSVNLYNGSIGKKNKLEKALRTHSISDDDDLASRTKRLESRGYRKVEV